jgi:hypothetical protein
MIAPSKETTVSDGLRYIGHQPESPLDKFLFRGTRITRSRVIFGPLSRMCECAIYAAPPCTRAALMLIVSANDHQQKTKSSEAAQAQRERSPLRQDTTTSQLNLSAADRPGAHLFPATGQKNPQPRSRANARWRLLVEPAWQRGEALSGENFAHRSGAQRRPLSGVRR